jgi:Skp family chaperone for outer membrane proteins
MAEGLDKAQSDYKQLLDQAADPAISADERDKRKLAAANKIKEITGKKGELEQFQRQADAQLSDQSQRMSSNLVTEIQKAVADKAKAGGYTMVVNSLSSETIIYIDTSNDLTVAVLAQLNAGAPIDLTNPSGAGAFGVKTNQP